MAKIKYCSVEGCFDEVAIFPGSTIRGQYCRGHKILKAIEKSRSYQTKQANKAKTDQRKETDKKKVDLMSIDEYRAKKVQPLINEIARLIDYGQPCIATGTFGKMSGGHYFAVGHNRTTALNLHNIHVQSYHSNSANGGDNIRYRDGIIKTYGIAYMERIEALKQLKPLHLNKEDLKQVKDIAMEIVTYMRKNPKVLTPDERIDLRDRVNESLNIY